ncbi:ABC transporter ATP-binding protein [Vineibacter terrae]|uniref:ABC transporter ATP-binding protein n=1 Tax=Vineibacter terrae TaxID=2586908 RepID=A0A5C8PJC8_9HYPH|nr:ABC transporter ATP-binding protein [Vineibacter terrae]TXL73924.1 ABC transporter ATP-binding protein [Vineibacter terrae]
MIVVDNVVAGYRTPAGLVKAVDRVSLEVRDGEILGIAGESGCGKTTLLKLLYGSFGDGLEIFSGRVYWRDPDGRRTIDCADFHRHWWEIFSYVPQGSMSALNPLMRIAPQMLDAGTGANRADMAARRARIARTLAELDLPARTQRLYPHQLSGGMRQRVMIGLAAYVDPDVVLADEPTTALDVVVQRQILENLVRLQRARRNTIVIVSHDLGLHRQVADRVAVLYAGRLAEIGSNDAVLGRPAHPYTQGLVDSLPRLGDRQPRQGIDGRPPDFMAMPPGCRFAPRCRRAIAACAGSDPDPRPHGSDRTAACIQLEEVAA